MGGREPARVDSNSSGGLLSLSAGATVRLEIKRVDPRAYEPTRPSPLALTQGDPSGIGPEIALKAFRARETADLPPFFVVGDPALFARVSKSLGLDVGVEATTPAGAVEVFARALPVVSLGGLSMVFRARPTLSTRR